MARGPVLVVFIESDTKGLNKGLDDAAKSVGGLGGAAAKWGPKIAGVAAGVGAAAVAARKLAGAADKAAVNQAAFAAAMEAAGIATGTWEQSTKDAIAASKNLAFSGAETQDSLQALVLATRDVDEATRLLAIAQDVARLSGADLTTASDAVAKAYNGADRALMALIPGLQKGATGMDTIANAERAAAGQADVFAASGEAMGIRLGAAFKSIAVSVGKLVLPAFKAVLPALLPIVDSFAKLVDAVLPALIPLFNALAKVLNVVAKAISKVLDLVTRLINKVRELLGPLREAVSALGKLNPFSRSINAATTAGVTARGVGTTTTATAAGGVTINIYGDPAVIESRVAKAIRSYQGRNGVGSIFNPGRS